MLRVTKWVRKYRYNRRLKCFNKQPKIKSMNCLCAGDIKSNGNIKRKCKSCGFLPYVTDLNMIKYYR